MSIGGALQEEDRQGLDETILRQEDIGEGWKLQGQCHSRNAVHRWCMEDIEEGHVGGLQHIGLG